MDHVDVDTNHVEVETNHVDAEMKHVENHVGKRAFISFHFFAYGYIYFFIFVKFVAVARQSAFLLRLNFAMRKNIFSSACDLSDFFHRFDLSFREYFASLHGCIYSTS